MDELENTPRNCDVTVIGAGVGGLVAATLLARAGLEVCVLEAESKPGGYLAGFKRQGFVFDTAIHWLNQCGPGGMVRRLFDSIRHDSPETPLMNRIRRYRGDGFDYLLTSNPDELRDALISDFPEDREGLFAFFATARTLGAAFANISSTMRSPHTMTIGEKVRGLWRATMAGRSFLRVAGVPADKGLRRIFHGPILDRMWRAESGLIACLMPVAWAYTGDFQRPAVGGSQRIPTWLADVCREAGGEISCGCRAEQIVLKGDRATAVRFNRSGDHGVADEIRCRHVIAACDAETIYRRLLPAGTVSQRYGRRMDRAEVFDSAVSIFLGLSSTASDLGISEELVQITRDGISRREHTSGDPEKTEINLLLPSTSDSTLAPPGKTTAILYTTARISANDCWKTGPGLTRGEAYYEFKQRYADVIVDRVERTLGVDLHSRIEIREIATPVTYGRFTGNKDGAIMGYRPTRSNMWARLASRTTPVGNVLIGGQWAEIGGGLPAAVRAGANAAAIVLKAELPDAFAALKDVMDSPSAG